MAAPPDWNVSLILPYFFNKNREKAFLDLLTPLEIMSRLRGRSHFGAAKARCSSAWLRFHTILAGFNAPWNF
jgi:hypothetical protein